ncbi:phage baseplate assembly protein V [Ferdinandcohnia quinoae]|uniref:Phage baseplate assembly protein V n=1 Tax=Fredinandcohnia quinoae TaxID=2918902 RepID=A0AAW5E1M7_9BACI|nr:phage baseplate assembly protein V [Fredinandcohnia sp. SECRCQ15]MCH1624649.1 phage baseplate assembly protein V [Fredinandcohnia sp. SECRCQ15]
MNTKKLDNHSLAGKPVQSSPFAEEMNAKIAAGANQKESVDKVYKRSENGNQSGKEPALTYKDIIVMPYNIRVHQIEITQQMNEHATLHLTGLIPSELEDIYVYTTDVETAIEVLQIVSDGQAIPIFNGLALDVQVKSVMNNYYLEVKAVSHTYVLDVKKKNQTYQNASMPYSELIDVCIADQKGADFIDCVTDGAKIGNFTMQYLETDWEFLKRMASRFHTGLVPETVYPSSKFYFGVPYQADGTKEMEAINYRIKKSIGNFLVSSENYLEGITDSDYMYYEVESIQPFKIGNEVTFQSRKLYVYKIFSTIKDGLFKHIYTLTPENGFSLRTSYNQAIIGASIQGNVIDIKGDKIRIHVDFDEDQDKDTAYWFPYSTIYASEDNTGWYVMPELSDNVRIYFPSNREDEGIALSSVTKSPPQSGAMLAESNQASGGQSSAAPAADSRQDPGRMVDPDVKTLRTKHGKQILLAPDRIVISGGGLLITLMDDNGISIISDKNINIKATEKVVINAKQIMINADEKIEMICKENSIKMEDKMEIKGTEVRAN